MKLESAIQNSTNKFASVVSVALAVVASPVSVRMDKN